MAEIILAGCIMRDFEGRILLLHRKVPPVQWELPGGKMEPGETPQEAAVREIGEELRCRVVILSQLGKASFTEGERRFRYIWFEAKIMEPDRPIVGETDKFDKLRYWDIETLKGMQKLLSRNMQNLLNSGLL
jgi:8-oxo-dGTP pyrophosphatase MutT (NUDIX family)